MSIKPNIKTNANSIKKVSDLSENINNLELNLRQTTESIKNKNIQKIQLQQEKEKLTDVTAILTLNENIKQLNNEINILESEKTNKQSKIEEPFKRMLEFMVSYYSLLTS